ncbi:hypothetical protein XENOCAPTIV_003020 [Xenoophorus captivus]|uniref:Crystaline entomocidal protoxin n=1 Tax=Xenoophorus captivus TaxID=1517983 RepID=A0ABV0RWN0_9TELE
MGQEVSQEHKQQDLDQYANEFFKSPQWNGFEIDSSLQKFSGHNSVAELNNYRDLVLQSGRLTEAASIVQRVGAEMGGLAMVPNAVGLGALVITLLLETIAKSWRKPTIGTAEMLQRVFAQEKGNEVRDLMEEYLKRLRIYLRRPEEVPAQTRQLELQLSTQLTRLKNAMMKDGHISTRLLNQWVNGAAFHTQMLIHLARLEGSDGSLASQAASVYHLQVNLLLEKYSSYLTDNLSRRNFMGVECCLFFEENKTSGFYTEYSLIVYFQTYPIACLQPKYPVCLREVSEIALTIMSKPQISWAKTYFSDLQANVPALVRQNEAFHIQMQ